MLYDQFDHGEDNSLSSTFVFFPHKNTMRHPKNPMWKVYFSKCMKSDRRFVFIPLAISRPNSAHANMYLIDKKYGTMELFEPNGYSNSTKNLDKHSIKIAKKLGFEYIPENKSCPYFGPQAIECTATRESCDPVGYCSIWNIFFLEMRVSFPDDDSKTLQKKLIVRTRKEASSNQMSHGLYLKKFISRYYQHLLEKTKYVVMKDIYNIHKTL